MAVEQLTEDDGSLRKESGGLDTFQKDRQHHFLGVTLLCIFLYPNNNTLDTSMTREDRYLLYFTPSVLNKKRIQERTDLGKFRTRVSLSNASHVQRNHISSAWEMYTRITKHRESPIQDRVPTSKKQMHSK